MRAQKAMSLYKESLNSLTDFERDEMKKEKAQEKVERAKRRQKKVSSRSGLLNQETLFYCFSHQFLR